MDKLFKRSMTLMRNRATGSPDAAKSSSDLNAPVSG